MEFFGKAQQKTSIDLSGKKPVSSTRTYRHGRMNVALFVALFVALLLTLFVSYHFYGKYAELKTVIGTTASTAIRAAGPAEAIIAAVDKHILLPTGEEPSIAKVSDLAPLKEYPFFRNATVGDEVIVYCKAQLSILYSPTRDKLIAVAEQALSGACE